MSSLTKEELKNALINHGAPVPPSSAKKEEFVQAYEEHIAPLEVENGGFSSEDEESTSSSKKRTSRSKLSTSSKISSSSKKSSGSPKKAKIIINETEGIEMTVDVESLDDDQLFEMLKKNGVTAGPIVGSTRKFYEKKLSIVLNGGNSSITGEEFSDTEPEAEEEEDDQPSVQVAPERRRSTRSLVTASPSSPVTLPESGLRQRLTLGEMRDEIDSSPVLGSPRSSIHSYKVTETTRQVTTRAQDGSETVDIKHSVERTELTKPDPPKKSLISRMIYPTIKLIILLILLFGLYVVFTTPSDGVTPVDKVVDKVMESIKDAVPPPSEAVEEVVFEAPTPTEAPPPVVTKPVVESIPDAGNVVDI